MCNVFPMQEYHGKLIFSRHPMYKLLIPLCALIFLAGCSHHYHPLDASKKERLVSELVTSTPQCRAFKEKLASPKIDDDAVDRIFHEALDAHCIEKDV